MNPKALVYCSILTIATASDENDAVARFSNNDRLAGSLTSLSIDRLVWTSLVLEKPGTFFLKNVIDLSLPSMPRRSTGACEATVKLTNGDSLCGQLAAVTDEALVLDTWYAGRVNLNRLTVAGVTISGRSEFIYQGPDGLAGWKQAQDKAAWAYRRSALVSHAAGSIARDALLSDECIIRFDVAWMGDALGLKVNIFSAGMATDDPSSDGPASGYEFNFQRGSISLHQCKTRNFLGIAHAQALMENDKAHIEIRASMKSGAISLSINERLIEVWSDPEANKTKPGPNLRFASQNSSSIRISAISIAPWDGILDQMPPPKIGMMQQFGRPMLDEEAPPPEREKPKPGRMELSNGDSLDGEVTSIIDGVIALKTSLGEIQLPLERLRTLTLQKSGLERCKRRNGDIRAFFPDGSSVVFRLDAVGDGSLLGSSQNFGTATFKTAAFNRIEFNIHDPARDTQHPPGDW